MAENDPSIADSTDVFRRIHPEQVVWDENQGRLRPTTAAFRDVEMSINLGDDLAREGFTPQFAVRNHPRHHLIALTAGFVRGEAQAVCREHLPDDPTHGIVLGPKPKPRRGRFASSANWEILRENELSEELRQHMPVAPDPPAAERTPERASFVARLIRSWKQTWKR